jgi:predicted ATPase/class 3 adenylate cyclase
MASLRLSLLGPFEAAVGERPLSRFRSNKVQALLIYLATEAGVAHRRDALMALLWPGLPQRSAQVNLRQTLYLLRQAIPELTTRDGADTVPFLLSDRHTAQINPAADVQLDVAVFVSLLEEGPTDQQAMQRLEQAVALYRGDFLCDFYLPDSETFEDWAAAVRARLRQAALGALEMLINHHIEQGSYPQAQTYARRALAIDNLRESAHRGLMTALALDGQRNAAVRQYQACARVLEQELGIPPSAEMTALYERIRDGELAPSKQKEDVGAISVSRETQAHPPPSVSLLRRAQDGLPTVGRGELQGERRVVTAMFADVKGSTALAGQIDTEDWVEIMRHALQTLSAEIHRYGGEIDRYEGDGLVAFFGLSTTHEDDAERAVLAALAMQETIKRYAKELAEEQGIELLLRVGLSSGEVITTHVGEARQHGEATAMGRTVALAARLEPAAEPGTVLVGEHTYRLVERAFEWQAMGGIAAKGYSEPVAAYRPLKHRAMPGKERGIEGLESPLVGRDQELHALEEAIERLRSGIGGIITVVGEAGIGKSRLVADCRGGVTQQSWAQAVPSLQWVEGRCLSYATNTAYQVWLDMVRELLGIAPDDPAAAVRTALAEWVRTFCPDCYEDVYPYMARMMSLSLDEGNEAVLRGLGAQRLKVSTFRAVRTLIERAAQRRPLVLVCEDLHWADPTSLELLERLIPLVDYIPLLLLCILRPERHHGCWRIIETAARDYPHRHADLRLRPLSPVESEVLVGNLLHVEDLPEGLRSGVLDRAEGNPFFVEEILRSLIDGGIIGHDEVAGRWYATRDLVDIPIPDTLHGALSARIDRLKPETKRALQLASVIGRIFTYPVLAAIHSPLRGGRDSCSAARGFARAGGEGEKALDTHLLAHLVTLERAQLVRERAGLPEREYIFKHHLTQEAAYSSLLKRERRVYHGQVAEALERLYPERIEEQVELLAHHWEQAGQAEKAIRYLHQAGDKAVQQSAYQEGRAHLTRALALLEALPDAASPEERLQRAEQELALQVSLGAACLATYGAHSEAARAYDRARELCQQMGKTSQLGPILGALAVLGYVGAEYQNARTLGQEALKLAQQTGDPVLLAASHWRLGFILFALGEYTAAHAHLEQTMVFHEPHHHQALISMCVANPGPSAIAYDACCLWCLGYPDQALQRSEEALTLARELDHPFTLGDVLSYAGCQLHVMRRDAQALKESAEELLRLPSGMDLIWWMQGTLHRGEALAMLGQIQEGVAQMREGIAAFHAIGARTLLPGTLGSLAVAQAKAGQLQEGLATLAEALDLVAETDEHHWEAELYRLRGELLLMQGDDAGSEASLREAESCFQHAIEVARHQQAKSWELRATTSLTRLWRKQGRTVEAHQMLAEIYGWFTEGFDTPDMQEAKALLNELT